MLNGKLYLIQECVGGTAIALTAKNDKTALSLASESLSTNVDNLKVLSKLKGNQLMKKYEEVTTLYSMIDVIGKQSMIIQMCCDGAPAWAIKKENEGVRNSIASLLDIKISSFKFKRDFRECTLALLTSNDFVADGDIGEAVKLLAFIQEYCRRLTMQIDYKTFGGLFSNTVQADADMRKYIGL